MLLAILSFPYNNIDLQFSLVSSCIQLFVTPWTAGHQASLSIINSCSLLKLISVQSVMMSNYLIICHPLLLLPSILPSIRVFFDESVLHIRWPKYWSFSLTVSPSKEHSGLISFRMVGSPCSRHVLNLRSITLSPLGRFPGSEAPEGPTLMLWAYLNTYLY